MGIWRRIYFSSIRAAHIRSKKEEKRSRAFYIAYVTRLSLAATKIVQYRRDVTYLMYLTLYCERVRQVFLYVSMGDGTKLSLASPLLRLKRPIEKGPGILFPHIVFARFVTHAIVAATIDTTVFDATKEEFNPIPGLHLILRRIVLLFHNPH